MPSLIHDHNVNEYGNFRHIDPSKKNNLTREVMLQHTSIISGKAINKLDNVIKLTSLQS